MTAALFPIAASEHAGEVDTIMFIVLSVIALLWLGWTSVFVYSLVKFRASKHPDANPDAPKSRAAFWVAFLVALIECVLLVAFSIPFWERQVEAVPTADMNPIQVRVVAQQYTWNIHYPGADGVFGKTAIKFMDDGSNPVGLDPDDAQGKDDIVKRNQLYLPVNRTALLQLTTKDVIHSFAVPEFRVKRDIIPGMVVPMMFKPTLTTTDFQGLKNDDQRTFEIACSQLCGIMHYAMRGFVYVLTEEEFETWLVDNAPKEVTEEDEFWDEF